MPRRPRKKGRKEWDPREEVQSFAQEFAEKAAVRPRDFAYFGDLPLGDTWGYVFGRSRDSDLIQISNYETIKADLEERFPDDVRDEGASHWAVGWVDQLAVRLLDEDGRATRAAEAAYEWHEKLKGYPVADDEDLGDRVYEATVKNIQTEGGIKKGVAEDVYSWLADNDPETVEDDYDGGAWVEKEVIEEALWAIGKPRPDMIKKKEAQEGTEWEAMTPEEREAKRRREYVDPPEQQRLFGSRGFDPEEFRSDEAMYAKGYRYKLVPASGSFQPLYAKSMPEATALMREEYPRERFEVISLYPPRRKARRGLSGRKSWDPREPKRKRERKTFLKAPYDDRLPSEPPFMWVERHDRVGPLGILAFGAFNAMGLIGSEKGGVAVVYEDPPEIIATKDIPWDPEARDREVSRVTGILLSLGAYYNQLSVEQRQELLRQLRASGYGVRWVS